MWWPHLLSWQKIFVDKPRDVQLPRHHLIQMQSCSLDFFHSARLMLSYMLTSNISVYTWHCKMCPYAWNTGTANVTFFRRSLRLFAWIWLCIPIMKNVTLFSDNQIYGCYKFNSQKIKCPIYVYMNKLMPNRMHFTVYIYFAKQSKHTCGTQITCCEARMTILTK